jgi:hypothetical protein
MPSCSVWLPAIAWYALLCTYLFCRCVKLSSSNLFPCALSGSRLCCSCQWRTSRPVAARDESYKVGETGSLLCVPCHCSNIACAGEGYLAAHTC